MCAIRAQFEIEIFGAVIRNMLGVCVCVATLSCGISFVFDVAIAINI